METELSDSHKRNKKLKKDVKKINLVNEQVSRDYNIVRDIAMEPFKSLPDLGCSINYNPSAIAALAVKHKPKATANNSRARADNDKVVYRPSVNDKYMKPPPKH